MFRNDKESIALRAAVNHVISAFNDGDVETVRDGGRDICDAYFSGNVGFRDDVDVLNSLVQLFDAGHLEQEATHMRDALDNLPQPFVLPPGDTHFSPFIEDGSYQLAQREAAYLHIANWSLAIDVGAHVGFWTNDLARRFDHVQSFEPNPETFKCLEQNIPDNVTAHNCGLGDVNRSSFLTYPDGGGGTEPDNSGGWEMDDEGATGTYEVEIKRIDELELAPDFIKIDVQGYELGVLKGAYETINRHQPVILVELIAAGQRNDEAFDYIENTLGMIQKASVLKDFVYGWP